MRMQISLLLSSDDLEKVGDYLKSSIFLIEKFYLQKFYLLKKVKKETNPNVFDYNSGYFSVSLKNFFNLTFNPVHSVAIFN